MALHPPAGITLDTGPVPLGGSKVGGRPHVPGSFAWPGDMAFLAQLNLAECPGGVLPPEGLLYLFSTWDDSVLADYEEGESAVLFHPGPASGLTVAGIPDAVHRIEGRFAERRISFTTAVEPDDSGYPGPSMFGAPAFFREELAGVVDPARTTLLLHLPGMSVWRSDDDHGSIYGDGGFFVLADDDDLRAGNLGAARVLFEPGT